VEVRTSQIVDVQALTHVAEARRAAATAARSATLSRDRASDLAIVVSELASNMMKHAGGGALVLRGDPGSVDVIALDKGPGMDVLKCIQDGYSTSGTMGGGLGAVARLTATMEIHTERGAGTVIYARVGERSVADAGGRPGVQVGAISLPVRGETICGDVCMVRETDRQCSVFVADGLGHGPLAADAATAAADTFDKHWHEEPTAVITAVHGRLRTTRGAAIALAQIDFVAGTVTFCGIGNISGTVVGGQVARRMVSHNGTAGMGTPRMAAFTYPWGPLATVILHSDGITTRWDLGKYAGLETKHCALIAGVLYRDFFRGKDDATVIAVRKPPR
jgi:anti-sigma regulatory factor (Ser/Thr protein kinase)